MIKCNKFLATVFSVTLLLGNCPKAKATPPYGPPYGDSQDELSNNCVRNVYEELNSTERLVIALGEIDKDLIELCLKICVQLSDIRVETLYNLIKETFSYAAKEAIPNFDNNNPFLIEGWQDFSNSLSYAIIAAGVNSYCPRYQQELENLKTIIFLDEYFHDRID